MVNVIGLGYIGLPTALMMASHGVEVIGTDYNKELVAMLNAGKTTFKEKLIAIRKGGLIEVIIVFGISMAGMFLGWFTPT